MDACLYFYQLNAIEDNVKFKCGGRLPIPKNFQKFSTFQNSMLVVPSFEDAYKGIQEHLHGYFHENYTFPC